MRSHVGVHDRVDHLTPLTFSFLTGLFTEVRPDLLGLRRELPDLGHLFVQVVRAVCASGFDPLSVDSRGGEDEVDEPGPVLTPEVLEFLLLEFVLGLALSLKLFLLLYVR